MGVARGGEWSEVNTNGKGYGQWWGVPETAPSQELYPSRRHANVC